jgi:hypothetical protein
MAITSSFSSSPRNCFCRCSSIASIYHRLHPAHKHILCTCRTSHAIVETTF